MAFALHVKYARPLSVLRYVPLLGRVGVLSPVIIGTLPSIFFIPVVLGIVVHSLPFVHSTVVLFLSKSLF
jgi:hypothetical protein